MLQQAHLPLAFFLRFLLRFLLDLLAPSCRRSHGRGLILHVAILQEARVLSLLPLASEVSPQHREGMKVHLRYRC